MKIAGVSVNLNSLPTKEQLIRLALNTKEYYQKRDAKKLIEKEIKASGLFKSTIKRTAKPKGSTTKDSDGRDNNKQSKHNKSSKT